MTTGRGSIGKEIAEMASQIDKNLLLELLKNPLTGLRLEPTKDIKYGFIGLAGSIIGFLIWSIFISNKIGSIFGEFNFLMGESSLDSQLLGKLILNGIVSILSLMAAVWVIGNWQGNRKTSWKEIVTRLGSMQLSFGAGFIIAGILGLFSLYLSVLALGIVLLTNFYITLLGGNEIYEIHAEKRFSFTAITTATYLILFYVLFKILN